MSNGSTGGQLVPLSVSIAPFPEGFKGDMDETFQEAVALMDAYIEGNFLTGLILPLGSTLPTTDQGPVLMGNQWYFWDPVTNQYLPQSQSVKVATNYVKNPTYQVRQTGNTFGTTSVGIGAGITNVYDMAQLRSQSSGILNLANYSGLPAGLFNDQILTSAQYNVVNTVTTINSGDIYAHEHLVEGADLAPAQGQILSLSFWVWCNAPGTYPVYITSGGRDCSFVSSFHIATASTWTRVVVPNIPAIPTTIGTWPTGEGQTGCYIGFGFALGGQWLSSAPGSWQNGFFATVAGASNLLAVASNKMAITGIKLEAASAPTYLAVKSLEGDYHDCIRYYWTNFTDSTLSGGVPLIFVAAGTTAAYGTLVFPRKMCRPPSTGATSNAVVPYSTSTLASGKVYDVNSAVDVTVATLPATAKGTGGAITITGTKGDILGAYVIADARLS